MRWNCWSLRCSWSIAWGRCSNYIFMLDLTPGCNELRKENCKTRQGTFKCYYLVWLILEIWRYIYLFTKHDNWHYLHTRFFSLHRQPGVCAHVGALLYVASEIVSGGSILGPMGSHCVQKMGPNRKKLPCSKTGIFDYPTVIAFPKKMEVTLMARNHGGDPLGSILGPMGSHWVQKRVKTVKNYNASKFEFSTTPRLLIFPKKWKLQL